MPDFRLPLSPDDKKTLAGRIRVHLSGLAGALMAGALVLTEWGASQWVALPLVGYALGYSIANVGPSAVRTWRRAKARKAARESLFSKALCPLPDMSAAQRARANHRLRTRVAPRLSPMARSLLFELLDVLDRVELQERGPQEQVLGEEGLGPVLQGLALPSAEQVQFQGQARQLREQLLPETLRLYFALATPTAQAERLLHSQLQLLLAQSLSLLSAQEAWALRPLQIQQQFLEDKWPGSFEALSLPAQRRDTARILAESAALGSQNKGTAAPPTSLDSRKP